MKLPQTLTTVIDSLKSFKPVALNSLSKVYDFALMIYNGWESIELQYKGIFHIIKNRYSLVK